MTTDAAGFKDAIRDQWTHASAIWGKWHPKFAQMTGAVTQALCDVADLKPGLRVLDLAGGTGEPSLTVAQRVAPGGSVVYSDFVGEMVEVARENAHRANISNIEFRQVDAEDIPFEADEFDRVVSRFGVMFFPDTHKALSEVRRVLKPGGAVAFVVWQAVSQNPWYEEINGMLARRGLLTPPPPGMPGPFRFGEPDSLPKEMRAAGFDGVGETAHSLEWTWPGPAEEYADFLKGTLPPVRKAIEQVGEELEQELRAVVRRRERDGEIHFEARVFSVTATNPS